MYKASAVVSGRVGYILSPEKVLKKPIISTTTHNIFHDDEKKYGLGWTHTVRSQPASSRLCKVPTMTTNFGRYCQGTLISRNSHGCLAIIVAIADFGEFNETLVSLTSDTPKLRWIFHCRVIFTCVRT